jgi:hypothetical protein
MKAKPYKEPGKQQRYIGMLQAASAVKRTGMNAGTFHVLTDAYLFLPEP